MNVIIFGATGMIGSGVLLECLDDTRVESVLTIGRTATGVKHPKLREIARADLFDYADIQDQLTGYDACFFCLGVSSTGMSEVDYQRITYDLALAAAETLARVNPGSTFCFVSGQGTDSTEKGRVMWARVKGKTENHLLRLPLDAYMFRPGLIQPVRGVRSKTRLYQTLYNIVGPIFPLLRRLFPRQITTTAVIGHAMLRVATEGYEKRILETPDINALGAQDAA